MQLTTRDLYRLRHRRLSAQRAALHAQRAQQELEELMLEVERRYNLLGQDASLDLRTGTITVRRGDEGVSAMPYATPRPALQEEAHGSANHAQSSTP